MIRQALKERNYSMLSKELLVERHIIKDEDWRRNDRGYKYTFVVD